MTITPFLGLMGVLAGVLRKLKCIQDGSNIYIGGLRKERALSPMAPAVTGRCNLKAYIIMKNQSTFMKDNI